MELASLKGIDFRDLDISEKLSEVISIGDEIALRDKEGFALAIMNVESKWKVDKAFEAQSVFGTSDIIHPGVNFLQNNNLNRSFYRNHILGHRFQCMDHQLFLTHQYSSFCHYLHKRG